MQPKFMNLPPLANHAGLRYFTFIILYFSQGIPEGITIFAIPAWLAMNGKSAGDIAAYSAVIMVPFSFKIVLAPFMERYTYLAMGRRRPWLLFGQAGIFLSLLGLAFIPDPINHILWLSLAALSVHIFVLFQDIATDSLVIDLVPLEQQGKANSFMWGSKTVGISISLALSGMLIHSIGFTLALALISISILMIMVVPLIINEREGEKKLPWTRGSVSPAAAIMVVDSWKKMFKSFKQAIFLKNSLLLFLSIFSCMAAIHYLRTLLPIFIIQHLKWDNIAYSNLYSTFNLTGGILGMLLGGFIILKFGLIRMIQGSAFFFILLLIPAILYPEIWSNPAIVTTFVGISCTLITLIIIGSLALAMRLCWKRISALQFTFCMSIFNFGLTTGAALFGITQSLFSWPTVFIILIILMGITILILVFLDINSHQDQVIDLENNYLKTLEMEGKLLIHPDGM